MIYSIKLTHEKAQDLIATIGKFTSQYLGADLGQLNGNVINRYAVATKRVRSENDPLIGYTIGVMVDLDISGKYSHITLKVYITDVEDCYAGVPIDMSNKNWSTFASAAIDAFHYLGKKQIKKQEESADNRMLAER